VTTEAAFIAALRAIATAPAARGLADDAAVLDVGGSRLVLTMDAIVEGVHFLRDDPADSVAWKLVATNVSDLAAKGAVPRGCLLTYPLAADPDWDAAFLRGLEEAVRHFAIPLLGGDTVRQPEGSPRSFSLVALGEPEAGVAVPSRGGARSGDRLWLSGPVGDAGLGLAVLRGERHTAPEHRAALAERYRRPSPRPMLGAALAPHVHAMMAVSDGVLIDAARLAAASEVAAVVELGQLPLSRAFVETVGDSLPERLFAAGAGDDYCLLFAAPPEADTMLERIAAWHRNSLYPVGRVMGGRGLSLLYQDDPVPLPGRLGFQH
jgi:thiamine-monophosphate kinase